MVFSEETERPLFVGLSPRGSGKGNVQRRVLRMVLFGEKL